MLAGLDVSNNPDRDKASRWHAITRSQPDGVGLRASYRGLMNNWDTDFVIFGEPGTKGNQRQIVKIRGMPRIIKSKKALAYGKLFDEQCPVLDPLLEGFLAVRFDVWYASNRPDLAASELIKDLLQGKIYANDKQIKAEQSLWNLDRENPRVRIRLRKINCESSTEMSSLKASKIWGRGES